MSEALDAAHAMFYRWMGDEYDIGALDVVLASAAVEQLDGDPIWLMLVSGSGNAKTETVCSLSNVANMIVSTITSEAALLSATASKDRTKEATGGMLVELGAHGMIIIKDFTSIISMNMELRRSVLAALREIYDGHWTRRYGADGGGNLSWTGRIVVIAACTTKYDTAHAVISQMGERFAVIRMDSASAVGRGSSGRQALRNVGHEDQMRKELAQAASDVLRHIDKTKTDLTPIVQEVLFLAADFVTLARTAIETDYQGNPEDAHAPEAPTRYAKMLGQVVRGGLSIGMTEDEAVAAALRVAHDSIPPLRRDVLRYVRDHPDSSGRDVGRGLQKPTRTVDRALQSLHLIGLIHKSDGLQGAWLWRRSEEVTAAGWRVLDCATFIGNQTQARAMIADADLETKNLPTDKDGAVSEEGQSPF